MKNIAGGNKYKIKFCIDEIPIFIKSGSIVPLAEPNEFVSENTRFNITCFVYGENVRNFELFEDDGVTFDFEAGKYNKSCFKLE